MISTTFLKSTVRPWPSVSAVVEHLQQYVKNIRMGFFDFVEQHHLIGPADRFGQHAALVADIAGRRSINARPNASP